MLTHLLTTLVLVPILGFVGCVAAPRKQERAIFVVAASAIFLELVVLFLLGYRWLSAGSRPVLAHVGSLYTSAHYSLSLDFYFDKLAAVFFGMTSVMTALVLVFSKYYLHREQGFKRFYSTVMLFFIGLSLIILGDNFEVLFVGWEFIGMSSILLIAFYRDRFLPARNALKVFSVYRIADAFLLAAIWYAHHLFEKSVHFSEFSQVAAQHGNRLALLGLLLFVAALIKSAQFPFSYWLPRAMEGPTTSSAIFYGALSVHMGLYLMLRTYPLWDGSIGLRIAIAAVGLVTALVASSITRVQSSVKTQIAYASITQIGIMFVELAAGLRWLVVLHFVSNAALRTYQLLISPSAVSYLVHDQFFYFVRPVHKIKNTFAGKLRATLYVLGVKEWNMNTAASRYLWKPLKSAGRACASLDGFAVQAIFLAVFAVMLKVVASGAASMRSMMVFSTIAAIVSIAFYTRAYASKRSARVCWNLILLGHLFGMLFLASTTVWQWKYVGMYGIGVLAAFFAGHACLWYLETRGESNGLRDYQGAVFAFPKVGQFFFIVTLLFMAFPISPSFLAQDVLLSSIPLKHAFEVALFGVSYVLVGVSCMRLYAKVFFGSHKTSYHEVAFKSS